MSSSHDQLAVNAIQNQDALSEPNMMSPVAQQPNHSIQPSKFKSHRKSAYEMVPQPEGIHINIKRRSVPRPHTSGGSVNQSDFHILKKPSQIH